MATSKKNTAYLKRCRDRIQAAKGFRKTEGLDDLWKRLNDLYRGKHYPKNLSADDRMVVNICFATINVIGPSVAVNHPKVVVNATTPEDEDRATILEAVVNYWWRHFDVLPEFQRAVKDFLIFGFGYLKTGYRFVEEEVEDTQAIEAEYEARRAEVDQFAIDAPELAGDLPTDDELRASLASTTKTVVTHDQPFVERVSPFDIYVDPDATSLRDARWIAQKVIKSLEEVRKDERYKSAFRRTVKADGRVPDEWMSGSHKHDDTDTQRVTMWEYYDLSNGKMCVFAESGDESAVDPVDQPYAFGHPFVMLRNYDVPDQLYPMGELEALEPLQHELNLTRTAMFNDRKAFRRRWVYQPNAFDKVARGQLASDEDNIAIPVNGNTPLSEAIQPIPVNTPNPQLYQDSEVINSDMTNVSGVNEYQRGGMPEIRRTATEAAIIQDAANARAADKLAKVEWVISAVARRLVMLAQQYMDGPKTARITGMDDRPVFFEYAPEDIEGEYDFEVEGGSTQPMNEVQRRQTATQLLQTLAPFGDPQLGLVNMQEVIGYALRYGFGIKNPGRFMGPGPQVPVPVPVPMGPDGQPVDPNSAPPEAEQVAPPPDSAALPSVAAGLEGVDPALIAQLLGQVGLQL